MGLDDRSAAAVARGRRAGNGSVTVALAAVQRRYRKHRRTARSARGRGHAAPPASRRAISITSSSLTTGCCGRSSSTATATRWRLVSRRPDGRRRTRLRALEACVHRGVGADRCPVPEFEFARSVDEALDAARALGFPVVVKGPYGFGGLEVTVAHDAAAVRAASADAARALRPRLVQRCMYASNAGACVVYDRGVPLGFKAYLADCAYPTPNSASTVHDSSPIRRSSRSSARSARRPDFTACSASISLRPRTARRMAIEVNPRPTLGSRARRPTCGSSRRSSPAF